jgi:hypothetical protein
MTQYTDYKRYRWHDVEQGTSEWWELRKGIPTASEFKRILTGGGKLSTQADDYACELVADKHCLIPPEGVENFTNRAIRWGQQTEAEARRWYMMEHRHAVSNGGFCVTLDGRFGCSPDGLINELGGLELKCPQGKNHVSYCLKGELPNDYRPQVHGALWVTGALWWDFVSYCPGLPAFRVRVEPDDYTQRLGEALEAFHRRYLEIEEQVLNEVSS